MKKKKKKHGNANERGGRRKWVKIPLLPENVPQNPQEGNDTGPFQISGGTSHVAVSNLEIQISDVSIFQRQVFRCFLCVDDR